MPAPLAMSERRAVDHIVCALRRERADTLFPWPMAWLVRLAQILPKRWVIRVLRSEVPVLDSDTPAPAEIHSLFSSDPHDSALR